MDQTKSKEKEQLNTPKVIKISNEISNCVSVDKGMCVGSEPGAIELLKSGKIDLVINIPKEYDANGRPDGYFIRRAAMDLEIPLITDLWLARALVHALKKYSPNDLRVKSWSEYLNR